MIHLDLFPKWLIPNRVDIIAALAARCIRVVTHHEGRISIREDAQELSRLYKVTPSLLDAREDGRKRNHKGKKKSES